MDSEEYRTLLREFVVDTLHVIHPARNHRGFDLDGYINQVADSFMSLMTEDDTVGVNDLTTFDSGFASGVAYQIQKMQEGT